MFPFDGVLQRHDRPVVLRRRVDRWFSGELDDYNLIDDAELHRYTDIQLRNVPNRSRRNQRDRNRQPGLQWRDEHLLLDPGSGIGEWPEVQRVRGNSKSLLCGQAYTGRSTIDAAPSGTIPCPREESCSSRTRRFGRFASRSFRLSGFSRLLLRDFDNFIAEGPIPLEHTSTTYFPGPRRASNQVPRIQTTPPADLL